MRKGWVVCPGLNSYRGGREMSPLICVGLCPVPASLHFKKAVLTGPVAFSGLDWEVRFALDFSCLH